MNLRRACFVVPLVLLAAGCATPEAQQADETAAPADPLTGPRHAGRLVPLDGGWTAELAIRAEDGMTFVYLYDAEGRPIEYAGKEVKVTIATPDGERVELPLEGMGQGAGAHFMNPLSEAMVTHIRDQGGYTADIEVATPEGTQRGQLQVSLDS